jgi:hypothetical protein
MSPTILRIYMMRPENCNSDLAAQLYALSGQLYGTPALQARTLPPAPCPCRLNSSC